MKRLLLLILTFGSLQAQAQTAADSIWTDNYSGDRMIQEKHTGSDTLLYVKPRPLTGILETLAINAAVLSWDYFLFDDRSWSRISKNSIKTNLTDGWTWDDDSFSGNMFSHPFHGSMFYNAAREHGMSYGLSLLYPLIGSATWELFCENNRPAINDIFATGIGGSAIGEVTHRSADLIFDDSKRGAARVFRELTGSLLNPVRGLQRFLSGEMFRVNHHNKGKRVESDVYHFEIGLGNRWIADLGSAHPEYGRKYYQNIPFLDFSLEYGDHFNALDGGKTKAFDQFDVYALLNLASHNPTFGTLEISGRIASTQHTARHNWTLDWGFYQNYKYIDYYWKDGSLRPGNLPIISEAASFGGALFAQHAGKTSKLSNLLMLSAVPMGCSTADYYCSPTLFGITEVEGKEWVGKRRYNYGIGYSIRENLRMDINGNITLGNRLYFLNLYTLTGYNPAQVGKRHHNEVMGDKGYTSVITDTFYAHIHLNPRLKLKVEYQYYWRNNVADYYPNRISQSNEIKTSLTYSI